MYERRKKHMAFAVEGRKEREKSITAWADGKKVSRDIADIYWGRKPRRVVIIFE